MKHIAIVVPFYNEERSVDLFFDETIKAISKLKNYHFEFILVNDGSADQTLKCLKQKITKIEYKASIISFSRNFGHEFAINAGIDKCNADAAIIMDADLQDSPEYISLLLNKFDEGYDVVNVKRIDRFNDSFFKRFTAKIFYKLLRRLSNKIKIEENVNNFRLINNKVIQTIKQLPEKNRVFRCQVPFVGFKTTCVAAKREKRNNGKSHYNLSKMNKLAIDSVVSISTKPLDFSIKFFFFTLICFLLSSASEIVLFIVQNATNVISISSVAYIGWMIINIILLFFSIVLFVLAIISQYVARIHIESQKRPAYIVDEIISNHKDH